MPGHVIFGGRVCTMRVYTMPGYVPVTNTSLQFVGVLILVALIQGDVSGIFLESARLYG